MAHTLGIARPYHFVYIQAKRIERSLSEGCGGRRVDNALTPPPRILYHSACKNKRELQDSAGLDLMKELAGLVPAG